jgi:formylglycine-generating enzyme required for sulfatase activity
MVHQAVHRLCFFLLLSLLSFLGLHCGPDSEITGKDGAKMLLIPAGEFTMGGKKEEIPAHIDPSTFNIQAERPLHQVQISAFYLDKYEVTNALYSRFLEYLESTEDTTMDHPDQPADLDHTPRFVEQELRGAGHPAVGGNWYDAYAYCKWAGKRLPTEAEWEYAARGGEGYRKYPWGDQEPEAGGSWRANYKPEAGPGADGYPQTAPVGSFPAGDSPFGIADMAGNVNEWCQDWIDFSYYSSRADWEDPQGPEEGYIRAIRGGSYIGNKRFIRVGARLYGTPHSKSSYVGFRCARDLYYIE